MNFFIGFLLVVHFLVGVFLIVIVLMQRTKEGGMGAAFGAGVTESLFGASSGNVLTKITVWAAVIFFVTSLSMAVVFSHLKGGGSTVAGKSLKTLPVMPTNPSTQSGIPSSGGTNTGTMANSGTTGGTLGGGIINSGTPSAPPTMTIPAPGTQTPIAPPPPPVGGATVSPPRTTGGTLTLPPLIPPPAPAPQPNP